MERVMAMLLGTPTDSCHDIPQPRHKTLKHAGYCSHVEVSAANPGPKNKMVIEAFMIFLSISGAWLAQSVKRLDNGWAIWGLIEARTFSSPKPPRSAQGPIQPPIQLALKLYSAGKTAGS
jgi:hypothetical protein